MGSLSFKQVDVFTQRPFLGNPVAVVIGAEGLTADDMQRIAAWTNLSETTFVLPPSSSDADYRLRIFTPRQELSFAGHPIVGSAHAVIESGYALPKNGKLRQESGAGIIDLTIEATESGKQIFVKAPAPKIAPISRESTAALARALDVRLETAPLRIAVGPVWIVADVGQAEGVAALKPSLEAVARLSEASQATGVTAFGRATDGVSALHVRSFAPLLGIPEDPVCGSGNASVAAYLIHTGELNNFGSRYMARQGMQLGRDGRIAVRVDGDSIAIGGYAVTCVDGTLGI
ncbi:MAG TPA: PhzF family phenazine biosynthesis protein [Candidatus Binatia bacterium]|jgi:PhzF family phenazine biosynthesis protein